MQFTFPLDAYNASRRVPLLERDPTLFWRPKPNVWGHNSRGVYGREFSAEKPAGIYRIVTLGDSCTHSGPAPYAQRLQADLDGQAPGTFEVINAGVIGYTSYQGLLRLQKDVAAWSPDLITVYFGWNDHWLARGLRDSQQKGGGSLILGLHNGLSRLRSYQLANAIVARLRPAIPRSREMRVTPEEYAGNLLEMKTIADRIGATIWFMTAPHAFDLGTPAYLATSGETAPGEDLIALHGRYTDVVRATALSAKVPLLDLDGMFAAMPAARKRALFAEDHIHLSPEGKQKVADFLFDALMHSRSRPAT